MRTVVLLPFLAIALHAQTAQTVTSHIVIMDADGSDEKRILSTSRKFQSPNWTKDGHLLMNSDGKLWKLSVRGEGPFAVDSGPVAGIGDEHSVSRDGKWIAFSTDQVYLMPATGGSPKQITRESPSYLHGWSPD